MRHYLNLGAAGPPGSRTFVSSRHRRPGCQVRPEEPKEQHDAGARVHTIDLLGQGLVPPGDVRAQEDRQPAVPRTPLSDVSAYLPPHPPYEHACHRLNVSAPTVPPWWSNLCGAV
ncbi:hypothetical protein MRX96_048719 [Rhipicephalus microplus]